VVSIPLKANFAGKLVCYFKFKITSVKALTDEEQMECFHNLLPIVILSLFYKKLDSHSSFCLSVHRYENIRNR